ncbi:hypothetical protein G4B88_026099 [Cannabis sativa]|uniref:Uncharacterized protein n=1 Tax=Cannabis sativa TaxID=3483 RepID=A0A7J6EFT3_CANSA|nr:hypothetical protein G4B88_026099 [Cannabis sativa]
MGLLVRRYPNPRRLRKLVIFEVLDGRIWTGHNIRRFDCVRIKEAFADIGRPSPKPVGIIDSFGVLTQKFGRRANNMKMATLVDYQTD